MSKKIFWNRKFSGERSGEFGCVVERNRGNDVDHFWLGVSVGDQKKQIGNGGQRAELEETLG